MCCVSYDTVIHICVWCYMWGICARVLVGVVHTSVCLHVYVSRHDIYICVWHVSWYMILCVLSVDMCACIAMLAGWVEPGAGRVGEPPEAPAGQEGGRGRGWSRPRPRHAPVALPVPSPQRLQLGAPGSRSCSLSGLQPWGAEGLPRGTAPAFTHPVSSRSP